MKKCFKVAVVLLVLCLCCSMGVNADEGLSGTQITERLNQIPQEVIGNLELCETKIAISSAADLKSFRNRVNNGESTLSAYLTNDIDLNNETWTPIGTISHPFSGSFDGKGHMIYNLYNHFSTEDCGLFGSLSYAYVTGVVVVGEIYCTGVGGGITAYAENSVITNCGNLCDIITTGTVAGGIIGECYADYDPVSNPDTSKHSSTIIGCYNSAFVCGTGDQRAFVGGISGMNLGYISIIYCYNIGTVCSESGPAGGIVGNIGEYGFVADTYSVGEIFEDFSDTYGELCGYAADNGMIANSYYCYTGYPAINVNHSTSNHSMHYVTNINNLTTNAFIADLNNGNTSTIFFVADTQGLNDGFPVLNWEKSLNYHWSEGISLNKTTLTLNIGESFTLKATLSPSNVSNKMVKWTSLDPDIVKIDNNGMVTALSKGNATIYVGSGDGCSHATCKVTVTEPAPTVSFGDIKTTDYFYEPVNWAVAKGITSGTSTTTFSPNATCTRAQTVTFIWRAAGQPEPKSTYNPFTDVKASDYYYKAVLWAVEQGITSGTSKTTFSPNAGCTRGQVVTFLWRANGQPSVTTSNPFKDVIAGQYYYTAVLWAVAEGVTSGTSATTFSPNAICIRGQIVTFLYRNYN